MSEPPPPYAPNPSDGKTGQPPPPAGYQPQYSQMPYPQGQAGAGFSQAPPPGYPQAAPGYPQAAPGYPQGGQGYPQVYTQGGMQPGYPQQPGQGNPKKKYLVGPTVVIQPVHATTVVQQFRESPVQTVCPYCHAQIVTAVSYDTGTFTWLIAAIVCLVGCDLGCCFIPFCIDGCKDAVHHCPNCQQQVARWSRM